VQIGLAEERCCFSTVPVIYGKEASIGYSTEGILNSVRVFHESTIACIAIECQPDVFHGCGRLLLRWGASFCLHEGIE
jgi:hypothetical protein